MKGGISPAPVSNLLLTSQDSEWNFWYDLDSRLKSPQHFEDDEEVAQYLQQLLFDGGSVFYVKPRAFSIYEMQKEEVRELPAH